MSMSKYVTLSSSVPIYNKLLDHIENLLNEKDEKYCKILNIRNAILELRTGRVNPDDPSG